MTAGVSADGRVGAANPQFYIPATASLQERRPRTLKHGDTFAVFNHSGDVVAGAGSPEGLYHCDTRYLSSLCLSIGGARPLLLSSTLRDDNAVLTCDLTNPNLYEGSQIAVAQDLTHIRRMTFLWQAACYMRFAVRSFDDRPQRLRLTLEFAADFADLFEVRGSRRPQRGTAGAPELAGGAVTLTYTGLDRRRLATRLSFEPVPAWLDDRRAEFELQLEPRRLTGIFVEIRCGSTDAKEAPRKQFLVSLRAARRALRAASGRAAAIETSNQVFNEAVRRAISDLYMLITDQPEGPFPYAGIPWFSTAFGRDGLITALQTLWLDPAIARGVVAYLAANQAAAYDNAADAEPGKILHEVRQGEMALLGEVPFRRYYGSVDATLLFIVLAGDYLARTDDAAFLRRTWPNIEAALAWIDRDGDRDGDGFVEYGARATRGLVNQGWKDSRDSIFHADGGLAEGPIALVEVQAYVYAARRAAAAVARRLGLAKRGADLDAQAEALRARFDAAFWDEELGSYVLALDGSKRPCRVRTSNAGHTLFTGIALPHRAKRVVANLMSGASFSGWGVRTVAASEARYNPMSYHNGSVWPHDNALIALGFARYGFGREAARLLQGLFEAATYLDLRRLPELFCGFARHRGQGPTSYPVACSPQAWASTALFGVLQACLGIGFDPPNRSVTFHRPVLPAFLDEVKLHGLAVADARVDIALRRAGSEVAVNVLSRRGDIRVMTVT